MLRARREAGVAFGRAGNAAVLIAACLAVYLPALLNGLPQGDSHNLNVSWALAFVDALRTDGLYPRWLPSLWDGAGGADLAFYAPLPFFVLAVVDWFCAPCSIDISMTVSALLLRVFGALSMLGLLSALGFRRSALAGAVFFSVSPYHAIDWVDRQAFGELAGIAFLPLFFHGLFVALQGRSGVILCISAALLALSHLPTLVLAGLSGALLALTVWRPTQLAAFAITTLVGSLGMALAAVYWLPALWLMDTVNADALQVYDWREMIMKFAAEEWGLFDARIWTNLILMSGVAFFSVIFLRSMSDLARKSVVLLIGFTLFVATPLSLPLWAYTPLSLIQFPWRSLMIAELGVAIVVAGLAASVSARGGGLIRRGLSALCLGGLGVLAMVSVSVAWRVSVEPPKYPHTIENRLGTAEWLGRDDKPFGVPYLEIVKNGAPSNLIEQREILQPRGAIRRLELLTEEGRMVEFRAQCDGPCDVVVRRTYWRFWQMENTGSGASVPLTTTPDFPLILARLPGGEATYRLTLTDPPIYRVAALISLGALILTILMGVLQLRAHHRVPR